MRVLLIGVFHPEIVRGGAQQVCYELFEALQATPGIEPTLLAAIDPSCESLYKSGARITGFDGRPNEFLYLSREYDYWWHKSGNRLLHESFVEFLQLVQPEVVHFHHFMLLGLDLLTLTRRTLPNVRIVFTLHEFLGICAADGHMLRRNDRSLCRHASQVRCSQCFPGRRPEEFFMREMWVKRHFEAVDVFTTPSRFMIEHYVDWGLERDRIVHVTNGQRDYTGGHRLPASRGRHNRFGFFGQLVDDKGVWVLIEAVRQLRSEGFTDFVVEINGGNLQYASEARRAEIEAFQKEEEALPFEERRVFFLGSYAVDQLRQRMGRVDWCVVPSVWYETFALVISEAWMFGRPVIGSDVGAMAERIHHDKDGLLFGVGDSRALAETIRRACTEKGLWERLSGGIQAPPPREAMLEGMLDVYRDSASVQPGSTAVSSAVRPRSHRPRTAAMPEEAK